jgi:hypothetical protein
METGWEKPGRESSFIAGRSTLFYKGNHACFFALCSDFDIRWINPDCRRSRIPLGTKWLILAAASLAAWGTTFALYVRLPQSISITNWLPASGSNEYLQFTLDSSSWMLSLAVVSMLVGIVFTDTSRLGEKGSLREWTYSLLITSLGLLAVLANSSLVLF